MKASKKVSILLSSLLTINLLYFGGVKAKADEVNPISLKSVSVNENFLWPGTEAEVSVEAISSEELETEAYAVYIQQKGDTQIEKELTLTLQEGKYVGKIPVVGEQDFGKWQMSFLTISDKAHNVQIYYNSKIHGEIGVDLSNASFAAGDDISAPDISGITLSSNVIYPHEDLNIVLDANDKESGLSREASLVYVTKTEQGDVEREATLSLVDGKYKGTLKFDEDSKLGEYMISFIALSDRAGNSKIVYNSKVHGIGQDLSNYNFIVKTDLEGPQVNSIILSKNIAKLNDKVAVKINATDYTGLANEANLVYTINNFGTVLEQELTLNLVDGVYQGELTVSDQFVTGKWNVSYVALQDSLGNSSAVYNSKVHGIGQDLSSADLTVDFVAPEKPVITLSTEAFTNKDVQVTIVSPEANTSIEYKLGTDSHWLAYTAPFAVSENTTITARVIDAAGNVSDSTVKYVTNIDKKAPVITVTGVEDKAAYNKDVTVEIKVDDETATVTKSLTLDGKPIEIGKLDKDGSYILKVSAVDAAGNSSSIEYCFTIDKIVPVITVEGVEDGKEYTNTSVTPIIKISEGLAPVTLTLDGKDYDGKTAINSLGTHVLVIKAQDKAGNKSEKTITFTIKAVVTENTDSVVDAILHLVTSTDSGKTVVVDAKENPVVAAKIFEAVKGMDKQISFVVETQGMELKWTFNGKYITDTTTSIDLTLNAVAPNKDIILKAEPNAQIFSFKNHGELPAPMVVTIPVDPNKFDVTKPLYFYYYNEATKKAEPVGNALTAYKVGDKYFVDVTLTHNSDFFLSANDNATVTKSVEKLVQTGSSVDMNVLLMIGTALVAVGSLFFIRRRKLQ